MFTVSTSTNRQLTVSSSFIVPISWQIYRKLTKHPKNNKIIIINFFVLVCLLNVTDDAGAVSRQMANWLKNASTVSAPNPYQRQIFGGGKAKGVSSVL